MEVFSLLLFAIGLSALTFLNYQLYKKLRLTQKELEATKAKLNKVIIENILFAEQTDERSLFKENVLNLARKLFLALKRKLNLKATNYSELVSEIEKLNLKKEVKDQLVDFFNSIILLEYSKESLSREKKRMLKEQAIALLKRMGQVQLVQG